MKPVLPLLILCVSAATAAAVPWVTETDTEFFTSADVNFDGTDDVIVVDRATGTVRFGRQSGAGTLTWSAPKITGIENASAVAVGSFGFGGGTEVAVASPLANRVAVADDLPASDLRHLFPNQLLGPSALAALSGLPGQLAIGSALESSASGARLGLIDGSGNALFSPALPLTEVLLHGHTVQFESFGAESAAFLSGNRLIGWRFPAMSPELRIDAAGIANGSQWLCDFFDPLHNRPQVLHFVPGATTLTMQQIQGSGGGGMPDLILGAPSVFNMGMALRAVLNVRNGPVSRWLLALGENEARLFDFDGQAAPVLRQSWTPPPGAGFTAAAGVPGGSLFLFSGNNGISSAWQHLPFNGISHGSGASGLLPALPTVTARGSHVFGFLINPFLFPDAPLQALGTAADWTTDAGMGAGTISVTTEHDGGASSGLGNPTVTSVRLPSWIGGTATVNQLADDCALYSFAGAESFRLPSVILSPPPGTYSGPVTVTISLAQTDPTAGIEFRTSASGPWLPYAGPLEINATTQLWIVARTASGNSPIRNAAYTLTTPGAPGVPPLVDADGDCLDDSWELAFGQTDPNADPDGDGQSNLAEFNAGSDPLDAGSAVPATVVAAVDLNVELAPPNSLRLSWSYPARLACPHFAIEGSTTMTAGSWSIQPASIQEISPNRFTTLLPRPGAGRFFYRIISGPPAP